MGPPQPLGGPQPSSGAALEDSELCGDISSRAASSCELETMEQRITGKEQSAIKHPALSRVPFGFVKISDVLQVLGAPDLSCFCTKHSPAPQSSARQKALGVSRLPLADTIEFATPGPEPCVGKPGWRLPFPHPLPPFVPVEFGREQGPTPASLLLAGHHNL